MKIPLTLGLFADVSIEDYEFLIPYKWHALKGKHTWYASHSPSRINGKSTRRIKMHRFIMGVPDGVQVDHRDGNGCNNLRENLRIATPSQNAANRKARDGYYKGVTERLGRFRATIKFNYKTIRLGTYDTKEEAAIVYDKAATELFGEFALLNFP